MVKARWEDYEEYTPLDHLLLLLANDDAEWFPVVLVGANTSKRSYPPPWAELEHPDTSPWVPNPAWRTGLKVEGGWEEVGRDPQRGS